MERKKYLVIGLGKSGKAASFFLLNKGHQVVAVDQKDSKILKEDPDIQKLIKDKNFLFFEEKDLFEKEVIFSVIISPGVDPNHPLVLEAKKRKISVIGEAELAMQHFTKNFTVGITGTNGKTTTTSLITHVLNNCGKKAIALGNIGHSLTSYSPKKDEILVIELSSYQLETLSTKCLDIGIVLNISPDHLDRYEHFEDYLLAKANIQNCLKKNAALLIPKKTFEKYKQTFFSDNVRIIEDLLQEKDLQKITRLLSCEKKQIANENVLASFIVCKTLGVSLEEFVLALMSFSSLKHRLEFVAAMNGIKFYNDSKATNIESVSYAVSQFKGPVILIAGGVDKKFSFASWQKSFENKVKKVFVLGQAAKRIKQELKLFLDVQIVTSLNDAIQKACKIAKKGDTILLSPGCSSFDMFKNYADRGDAFKQLVSNYLEKGESCR